MLELEIEPRFCETDGLGHINNAVFLEWFEQARVPIFKVFTPDLAIEKWRLIIARNEIDYLASVELSDRVTIRTGVSKIGNSSMHIKHECYAGGKLAASGMTVMIHYDYATKKALPIPATERNQLAAFLT